LEEIATALEKSGGLLASEESSLTGLIEVTRALRGRLNDSQSNLKPLAARLIGTILNSISSDSKVKIGKIVFSDLISAAMNDNKKIMGQAAIQALEFGVKKGEPESPNPSMEVFLFSFVNCLKDSEYKVKVLIVSGNFVVCSLTRLFFFYFSLPVCLIY